MFTILQRYLNIVVLTVSGCYVGYVGWLLFQDVYQPLFGSQIVTVESDSYVVPDAQVAAVLEQLTNKTTAVVPIDDLVNPLAGASTPATITTPGISIDTTAP